MKASGSYNPVTQSAEGSYEVNRTDYKESRISGLIWIGVVIGIIVVALYLIKNAVTSVIPTPQGIVDNAAKTITDIAGGIDDSIKRANQNSIDTVVRAAGATPGDAATEAYWDAAKRYLGEGAIQSTAISAGNVILSTPIINSLGQPLLAQAAIAGEGFRQDLDTYGDYQMLEDNPLKGVIVSTEGILRTGLGEWASPYNAGKAFAIWGHNTDNLIEGLGW